MLLIHFNLTWHIQCVLLQIVSNWSQINGQTNKLNFSALENNLQTNMSFEKLRLWIFSHGFKIFISQCLIWTIKVGIEYTAMTLFTFIQCNHLTYDTSKPSSERQWHYDRARIFLSHTLCPIKKWLSRHSYTP